MPPTQPSTPRCLLVTGGAGFIGSNFLHYWVTQHPGDRLVVLDALTYAGNRHTLIDLETRSNLRFVQGNICDRPLVDMLLTTEQIDTVVHFAAESHVDRSILNPSAFIETNMVGTFTLLESCRHHWLPPASPADASSRYRFLHISTDEVYGSLGPDDPAFTETTPYAPNSPYSASKAGSDHLVRAYHRTYGLPVVITNCSNNYGPYQFPEKLIPLMCINILLGKPLPIYGDGQNIRDWLYVSDHCRALDCVLHHGRLGETYNIGADAEIKNVDLVQQLCKLMNQLAPALPVNPAQHLMQFVGDRPGHDRRYAIDSSKLRYELGWKAQQTLETGLRDTVMWYLQHPDWWQPLLSADYQAYYQRLYVNRGQHLTNNSKFDAAVNQDE